MERRRQNLSPTHLLMDVCGFLLLCFQFGAECTFRWGSLWTGFGFSRINIREWPPCLRAGVSHCMKPAYLFSKRGAHSDQQVLQAGRLLPLPTPGSRGLFNASHSNRRTGFPFVVLICISLMTDDADRPAMCSLAIPVYSFIGSNF